MAGAHMVGYEDKKTGLMNEKKVYICFQKIYYL